MIGPIAGLGFVVFWGVAIRLWIIDGPRTPLIFIGLWCLGLFALGFFGLAHLAFWSFQAVLAAVLLIVERYKSAI
jgi:hypothetical protein